MDNQNSMRFAITLILTDFQFKKADSKIPISLRKLISKFPIKRKTKQKKKTKKKQGLTLSQFPRFPFYPYRPLNMCTVLCHIWGTPTKQGNK